MAEAVVKKTSLKVGLLYNIISIIGAVIVAIGVGYGFFYDTKNTLRHHGDDLKELKKDTHELKKDNNSTKIFKGVSSEEMKNLGEKVERIETSVEKMDDKLDRIILQTR